MSDYILVGLVAAVAAGIHRAMILWIYRSWFRQGLAGDAAFHLVVVRRLKQVGSYDGIPDFLIKDEPDTYPILFHRIAALFPLKVVERFPYLPNALVWIVMTTAVTLYAHYAGSRLLGLAGFQFALIFLSLFLGLASNVALDMNGLNYISLSERLLSRFCCGVYFLALAIFMSYGDGLSAVAAIAFGALTLISSMFGRQTLFFVTPLVSLFSLSVWPLLILVAGVLGALIIDRGYFLRGLRHMSQFSHAYRHHTKHSRYYKLGLSRFTDLKKVFGRGQGGLRPRIYELEHTEPTKIVFRYPEIILLFVLQVVWPGQITIPEITIVAATVVVYVATSTAALRHYGEANRYIEFGPWLIAVYILSKYATLGAVPTAIWLVYGAWIAVASLKKYRDWSVLVFPRSDVLNAFVGQLRLEPDATIFTVPFSLGAAIRARTKCRSLMYQGSAVTLELYEKFMDEIPFLKRDWRILAAEYNVSHIICERSYLDIMNSLIGWEYDFSSIEKIAINERYVAYRVTDPPPASRSHEG
jgi:hypothetical protein